MEGGYIDGRDEGLRCFRAIKDVGCVTHFFVFEGVVFTLKNIPNLIAQSVPSSARARPSDAGDSRGYRRIRAC